MVVLDDGHIGEVDAGKCMIAFGALLFPPGAGNDFSVKHDIHIMGPGVGGKAQAVGQIGPGVRVLHINGSLGAGNHNGLPGMLDQVGQGGCGIGHGVRAVGDYETVIPVVMGFNGRCDGQPVGRLDVGAVNVQDLDGINLAVGPAVRHIRQDFLRCDDRL